VSGRFFDTNVILPALDRNHPNHEKSLALLGSLGEERPHVTITVLGELYAGLTRAPRKGSPPLLSHGAALKTVVAAARGFTVHDVTVTDWVGCVEAKRTHVQWPIWDCLLWAAAKAALCAELLSEVAPPGGIEELDGVRFVNPFADR
jgi:predicted nucleic acid-binding protein